MKFIPLYIHIPFCRSKCSYCAFYSCTENSPLLRERFLDQLLTQIESYRELSGADFFKTIYMGGGTPSLLSVENLKRLFDFLGMYINSSLEEFSIECNPEDITEEFISFLNRSPVNRISLGVQSFNDDVLRKSGRKVDSRTINRAIDRIRQNWKGRFSIDIISGLPGQTLENQKEDIKKAVFSGVDHISCYSLILEENTPLSENRKYIPESEEEEMMWTICHDFLIHSDFKHYEISNYSRSHNESLHNLQYWKMNEYIGCGPGAVSMIYHEGIKRITNPQDVNDFMKGHEEIIEPFDFLFENFMMGLRTEKGIDREEFFKRFSHYPEDFIVHTMAEEKENTFRMTHSHFSLSDDSRMFMNRILIKIYDELSRNTIDFPINWP
ncbi:MAG: radical SAM family heme chaperone HemW [Spirochaetaceae bacterium]|nr:radical SAM family heme chaperone HemW [Spirochaetaceae bacterium]